MTRTHYAADPSSWLSLAHSNRRRAVGRGERRWRKPGDNDDGKEHTVSEAKKEVPADILKQTCTALIQGKAQDVKQMVQLALDGGVAPAAILNEALLAGMSIVGERFKKNEVYVPEVLIAARAMKSGMEILKPRLVAMGVKPRGVAVIGTVKGDLHDIGKNLVGMMLEGAGFQVVDQGIDVDAQKFVAAAREHKADVVGVSALLTTTMTNMKAVVDAVQASELAGKLRVMIGGAPVTQEFCDQIGADGYAPDAASAADLAKDLMSGQTAAEPAAVQAPAGKGHVAAAKKGRAKSASRK